MSTEIPAPERAQKTPTLQLVRGLIHLIAIVSVTLWGFLDWAMPFPGILVGLGALVLSALVWALFLSPRPVLPTDRFGQSFIELLLLAAAVASLITIGVPWWIAAIYGVAGAALGFQGGRRA